LGVGPSSTLVVFKQKGKGVAEPVPDKIAITCKNGRSEQIQIDSDTHQAPGKRTGGKKTQEILIRGRGIGEEAKNLWREGFVVIHQRKGAKGARAGPH